MMAGLSTSITVSSTQYTILEIIKWFFHSNFFKNSLSYFYMKLFMKLNNNTMSVFFHLFLFLADTKTTQWDDPRLHKLGGPVRSYWKTHLYIIFTKIDNKCLSAVILCDFHHEEYIFICLKYRKV